ncbi:2-hydroxycyclohexanecarboxyl-CoA dehydrogenase domain protein [Mycobacterium xenopi 4042]|uniref:2-hydroxycyclohexanecarboxyl-CoA dehydrogenase domain protein n=1 Tax=Mycobacterium xenopi 4042 TaxID=1299334 RepID=X7ZWC2_MYCXE|nr:2-hydroxycyclohexanecarboxyl-CoA dehydrogenase domain protein [Mycobacterium xenopi 4042]
MSGPTDTALLKQISDRSQSMFDALARAVPMKRIGTPDDVARRSCFSPVTARPTSPVKRCRSAVA